MDGIDGTVKDVSTTRGPALIVGTSVMPLWRLVTVVGRADPASGHFPDIDLAAIDDRRTVSRRHAELLYREDGFHLRDTGSTNGTYVNGARLEPLETCPLSDGDAVAFGAARVSFALAEAWPAGVAAEWEARTLMATPSLLGTVPGPAVKPGSTNRVLATILFTDIAASTATAAQIGDRGWHKVLEDHNRLIRAEIGLQHGREVNSTGDGFLVVFDAPGRALRCAQNVVEAVRPLGIEVRAGLHTGECEVTGLEITGISVHIAARVVAVAKPSEVLVTGTLRELVAGSELRFSARGARTLRGVPGSWRLYAFDGFGDAPASPAEA